MTRTVLLSLALLSLACGDDLPDVDGSLPEDTVACLPAEVVTALERHALDLAAAAELLEGHASSTEVPGFLLAPALPHPPALTATFMGPLAMECAEGRVYGPSCAQGRCARVECTGRGAGWVSHLWIDRPVSSPRWYFKEVDVLVAWEDGEPATAFGITTSARGPGGVDVSMLATGTMDERGMTLAAKLPALHPAGPTTLEYVDDASGHHGQLSIGELVVAEVDATAHLVPTGDCP